ncbi:hypothetical protein SAMN05444344_0383 [Tenacibaculum mesophilum]|uniref:SmpA / OmlA family protein n=1 Tax=Tenacibaculum mesophilum TaxID=104268 RepID=A0ABM7CIY1_9FLAO|nr:hypothetical protein [Tenacibaculum mesophilum]AZJ33790.1 hypothetical protein D6200_14935 [Tenacibaculum mesophilum]QFS29032.1 hypothetical protein F9Y86_11740 [Tenacibaculum mesophilum]SHF53639.1 hypothetical protein SAMN05444344_0383 [Tenacibaculum mesophilum]
MKKRIVLGLILIGLGCVSSEKKNFEDLQKVKINMHLTRVKSIMTNNPKLIKDAYWDTNLFVYYYNSPFTASDDYSIVFNKNDSLVVEIGYGD